MFNPASKGTKYVTQAGATKAIEAQLLEDNAERDWSGIDIDIEFNEDVTEDVSGVAVAWLNQATGTYRITGAGGLAPGSYGYRLKLTSGGPEIGYGPNGVERDTIRVVAV